MDAIRSAPAPSAPEPFWRRLRSIATYPLRGAALVTLVTLTLCSLLGLLPGIGWILSIVVWMATYKYAFDILRSTADGHVQAPEVLVDIGDGVVGRMVALQLVLIVVAVAVVMLAGPVIGLVAIGAMVFLQPGCIISLAIDGSLRRALNPAVPLGVVARVGWPYLAVFGLLFVIQASAAMAGAWLGRWMPPVIGDLALMLASCWGLFATFHLMGYLVYQYHEELGYAPERHRGGHGLPDRDGELRGRAEELIRDGDAAGALAVLGEEVRSRAVDLDTHELYHRLLLQGGDAAARLEHGRVYLNLLLAQKQERRALNLLRDALQVDPDFVPVLPEQAAQLAERAGQSGQSQLAYDAWRALLRAHPRHPEAARWGLTAGLLAAERFGRDDEALELLEQARGRCGDEELAVRIDAALKALRPAIS